MMMRMILGLDWLSVGAVAVAGRTHAASSQQVSCEGESGAQRAEAAASAGRPRREFRLIVGLPPLRTILGLALVK